MQKGADGIWSLTVGPLAPDVYRYNFIVDGVRALDLTNPKISSGGSQPWSYYEVPGDPPPIHSRRDVPHGSVQLRSYDVSGMNKVHTLQIYTPPDYDRFPHKRFPVLYLFDGGGDAEDGWVRLGRVPEIEENLLAEHKAVPMIVVMVFSDDDGDANAATGHPGFHARVLRRRHSLGGEDLSGQGGPRAQGDRRAGQWGHPGGHPGPSQHGQVRRGSFRSAPVRRSPRRRSTWTSSCRAFWRTPLRVNWKMKLLFFSVGDKDTRYPSEVRLDQILSTAGIHHEFHVILASMNGRRADHAGPGHAQAVSAEPLTHERAPRPSRAVRNLYR